MKKLPVTMLLAVLCLAFAGCTPAPAPEASAWTMAVVQSEDGAVIACDTSSADAYPDAKIMELTCSLDGSAIIITDASSGQAWRGTYTAVTMGEGQSPIFEAEFDDGSAYLVLGSTTYADGASRDTLIVAGGGYSMTCYAEE